MTEDLKAFLDGELRPGDHERYQKLFAEEADLEKTATDFRAISRVLAQEVRSPESHGLDSTLLRIQATRPKARVPFWTWGGTLATAAALILIAIFLPKDRPAGDAEAGSSVGSVGSVAMKSMVEENKAPLSLTPAPRTDAARVPPATAKPVEKAKERFSAGPEKTPQANLNFPVLPDVDHLQGMIGPERGQSVELSVVAGIETVRRMTKGAAGTVLKTTEPKNPLNPGDKEVLVSIPTENAEKYVQNLRSALAVYGTVSDPYAEPAAPARPETTVASAGAPSGAGGLSAGTRMAKTATPMADQASADPRTLEELEAEKEILRKRRAELLATFFEDAKPVKEVDAQLIEVQTLIDKRRTADRLAAPKRKLVKITLYSRLR